MTDEVFNRILQRYRLEADALSQDSNYREQDIVSGLQDTLYNNEQEAAATDYSAGSEFIDSLPSGARLRAKADIQKSITGQRDVQARRNAILQLRESRRLAQQGMSDIRNKMVQAERFMFTDLDEAEAVAPQLDGLRSDIVVDPATMSFKQVKKPVDEDRVRDEEIADYFGVPKELVAAKRSERAAAIVKAREAKDDQLWEAVSRAHQLEQWQAEKVAGDKKAATEIEKAQYDQVHKVIKEDNMARQMSPATRDEILAQDPSTVDPVMLRVAKKSDEISKSMDDDQQFENKVKFRDYLYRQIYNNRVRDNLNQGLPATDGIDSLTILTEATTRADNEWPARQKMRKDREAEKAKALGAASEVDKLFAPKNPELAKTPNEELDTEKDLQMGAALGMVPSNIDMSDRRQDFGAVPPEMEIPTQVMGDLLTTLRRSLRDTASKGAQDFAQATKSATRDKNWLNTTKAQVRKSTAQSRQHISDNALESGPLDWILDLGDRLEAYRQKNHNRNLNQYWDEKFREGRK